MFASKRTKNFVQILAGNFYLLPPSSIFSPCHCINTNQLDDKFKTCDKGWRGDGDGDDEGEVGKVGDP